MSDINEVFGLDDLDARMEEAGIPTPPTGLVLPTLSLSDEDLDASSGFVRIPAGITTQFMIYDVVPRVRPNRNTNVDELTWSVDFQAVESTWGPKKQVRFQSFLFRQTMAWKWGPFLKAVGLVEAGGNIDPQVFTKHEEIKGRIITATVEGYTWKGADGSYYQSFGGNKRPVPTDDTPYYESLGRFKKYEPSDQEESDEDSMEGLAEFSSPDNYL